MANKKLFTLGLCFGVATQLSSAVPTDILDRYYNQDYETVVSLLQKRTDNDSKLFLAKTYIALDKPQQAQDVVKQIHVGSKHTQVLHYSEYLKVISSKDLTTYATQAAGDSSRWGKWPSAFRNRAKWLVAMECLRQQKASQAESVLISLRRDSYAPKDVQLALINCAVLQKNSQKALQYYKELLQKYPDSDASRSVYKTIADISPSQLAFRWDGLFSAPELFAVMNTAYDKRLFNTAIELGQILVSNFNYSSYDFLLVFAQSYFEKKQYDKALDLLKAFESERLLSDQVAKSMFLRAQCYQKKSDFSASILEYRKLLLGFPKSQLISEVYYNLYWVYRADNRGKEFLPDFEAMKVACKNSSNFDKVCWELGWEAYVAGRYDEALSYFQMIPGNLDDEFQARVLYWSAKACESSDQALSAKLRDYCISKYAFTYYGTRLLLDSPLAVSSKYVDYFGSTIVPKDKFYLALYDLGLGEWAAQLLEDELDSKNLSQNLEKSYTLATLYQKMHQPNKAIRILGKLGLSFSPQGKPFSRELAEMVYPRAYWDLVQAESKKYGLDPYFVLSVMKQESAFKADARSRSGALGLMQIMPATAQGIAKSLKVEWKGESMMDDPETNIKFGVYYLSLMQERFNGNWVHMLSGYNAGPNITRKWVDDPAFQKKDLEEFVVNIPYSETHYYVMKILKNYWVYKMLYEKGDQTRYAQAATH